MRPRDNQRQRVYNAQQVLDSDFSSLVTVAECQEFVDKVVASAFFKRHWPTRGPVDVHPGYGHRRATYANGLIQLPWWSRTKPVILHELAHHTAPGGAAHGPPFARNYLLLVERFLGKEYAKRLRESYRAHHVKQERRTHA